MEKKNVLYNYLQRGLVRQVCGSDNTFNSKIESYWIKSGSIKVSSDDKTESTVLQPWYST